MKKKLFGVLASCSPFLAVLAEGESPTTPDAVMQSVSTTLQGYLASAFPIIAAIIGAGIGIWAVYKLVGLVKKGFGAGTGR